MSKTLDASQLIYTSFPNGNSPKKGFMVYSKSDDITPLEEEEILSAFRYSASSSLPFAPSKEEVETLFPRMFGFFRLTSGNYVIGRSTYIGQDYSKRYGNFIIHALVFKENPFSLVLPLMDSSFFKKCLTDEELYAPKAPSFLPKVTFDDKLPFKIPSLSIQDDYFASLLDIISSNIENKKINVYLDKKDMEEVTKCLYYCLDEEWKAKFYFMIYASGNNKLVNFSVRMKENVPLPNVMNPLVLFVNEKNYSQVLNAPISNYSLCLARMARQNVSLIPSFVLEVNSYVLKGLVKDREEACILKRLKNGEFTILLRFSEFLKYLHALRMLCSPLYFEKAYQYCLASFANEKKNIYETFFPLLGNEKKKEIFLNYFALKDFSSFSLFLKKVISSPLKEFAISYLLEYFKKNPSCISQTEYQKIFEIVYPYFEKEKQKEILLLLFDESFEKDPMFFNSFLLPLLKKEFSLDGSFAIEIYEKRKDRISSLKKMEFISVFYPYLGKEEQNRLWMDRFAAVLPNSKDITLNELLESPFGKREDGLSLLEQNLENFAKAFKDIHPELIFSLYLSKYIQGDSSSYSYLKDYFLWELKRNRAFAFFARKDIPSSLKKRLYESPFINVDTLRTYFNLNTQDKFAYLKEMLIDEELKDYPNFFKAYFFVESVFEKERQSLDSMLLNFLRTFKDIASLRSASSNIPQAQPIFKKIDMDKFSLQSFSSLEDYVRSYKNQVLLNRSYSQEDKKAANLSFFVKFASLLSLEKQNPFQKGLSGYASLKSFLGEEEDRKKLASILLPYLKKLTLTELDRDYFSNYSFLDYLKELEKQSLVPFSCRLVSDGRFLKQNTLLMEKELPLRNFSFLDKTAFASYEEEFVSLYLEDILKTYASLFAKYIQQRKNLEALNLAKTFVLPFAEAKNFEKIFLKTLKNDKYVLTMIGNYIVNDSISFENKLTSLCDSFFKSLDKKSREHCFDALKKEKNPTLLKYIDDYEKNHKGFFGRIFGK